MNYYEKSLFLILILIIHFSCSTKEQKSAHKGRQDITISKINIDSFKIDASNTSCMGRFFMDDTNIVFGDKLFASLYFYDLHGNLITRKLGKGRGPKEIPSDPFFFPIENNNHNYLAYDDKVILYKISKKTWEVKKIGKINYFQGKNTNNPGPADISFYKTWGGQLVTSFKFLQLKDSLIIYSIRDRDTQFDCYNPSTANKYYSSLKTFAFLNLENGVVERIVGGYPSSYNKNDSWRMFTSYTFTLNEDKLYVMHFPDSLIYAYGYPYNHPKNLLYVLGYKGKNMNKDYPIVTSKKEAHRKKVFKYGFYHTLKYIKETNLLFRGYNKGSHCNYDGLQVYKKNNLIGDIKVPKYFKVIGYNKPFYYAVKFRPDYQEQIFTIYKFKLN